MQQAFQQLQQQVQQQQQQLAHQQQLLQQHAQHAAATAAASSSSANVAAISKPFVKPRAPSTFNATDKAGELDQWEREMRYQFAAYGPALASDAARIAHAVSFLGPVALQWWDADPTHQTVSTWTDFVRLLRDRFRPINAAKLARTELYKIRQAPTQSASAHAARFQELLVATPTMHEDDRVHLFVQSLTPALKRRIGDRDFAALSDAIKAAVQSEGLYNVHVTTDASPVDPSSRMDLTALEHLSDTEYRGRTVGPLSAKPAEEQMEALRERLFALEAQHHRPRPSQNRTNRVEDLDIETVKDRLARNVCLRCGSDQHWKSECPQTHPKKSPPNRR